MQEGPINEINSVLLKREKTVFCLWDNELELITLISGKATPKTMSPSLWVHSGVIIDCDSMKCIKNKTNVRELYIIKKYENMMNIFQTHNE